jgi:hypothetical protein
MKSILQRAKLSSESRASSSAAKFRVDTSVSSHLSTSSTLEVSFPVYCFVANLDYDGRIVTDIEQEEKKEPLCRRTNYLSRSVEDIPTPLPGFATVSLPRPKQSLIRRTIILEHSLDDIKRVVRRKLGLAGNLDVRLTQIRGNSSIVLEDGNDFYHPLRWP